MGKKKKKPGRRDRDDHDSDDDPIALDREVAIAASDAALDLIDEAIEEEDVTSIGTVLMQCALRLAQHAAAEMLVDTGIQDAEKKRELSNDDLDDLIEKLEGKVNRMNQEKLWKVFMELMGHVLSRKTRGRYRVQIIEHLPEPDKRVEDEPPAPPDPDEKPEEPEDKDREQDE